MLDLQTFKVVVKSTKNGGLFIKVGEHKIAFDVSSQMDYMGQAKKFIESRGLSVLGCDYTTIVATNKVVQLTELFKFHQLSDKAQAKAIADYENDNVYFDDAVLDSLTELVEAFGFYDTRIDYSLDYSHIPFARLYGKFKKPSSDFLEELLSDYKDLEIQQIISLVKSLPNDFEVYDVGQYSDDDFEITNPDSIINFLEGVFLKIVKSVNDFMLESFEVDYAFQQSREFIVEDMMCNEWYFDVDGNFVKR